jgi:hypothetical protein
MNARPKVGVPEPGVSRGLTALDPTEERRHRQVQPMQYRILALAIHLGEARFRTAQLGDLGILPLRGYALPPHRPHITALLEHRVVEFARRSENREERVLLGARWIEPHLVQPAKFPVEARRFHHDNIAYENATRVAVFEQHRAPTLTASNDSTPLQQRAPRTPQLLRPADRRTGPRVATLPSWSLRWDFGLHRKTLRSTAHGLVVAAHEVHRTRPRGLAQREPDERRRRCA